MAGGGPCGREVFWYVGWLDSCRISGSTFNVPGSLRQTNDLDLGLGNGTAMKVTPETQGSPWQTFP